MANTPKEPPKNFIDALNEQEAAKKQDQNRADELQAINKAGIKNVEATNRTTEAVGKGAAAIKAGVKVTNPDLAKTGDVVSAVDAIHKLNLTTFNTNQGLPQLADNLVKLTQVVQALQKDYESKGVVGLSKQLAALVQKLDGVSKTLNNSKVEVDSGLQKTIDNLRQSIGAIDFNPTVNVAAPKVTMPKLDTSGMERILTDFTSKQNVDKFDLDDYYAQDLDELEPGIQYVGFINSKGEWYIIKNIEADNQLRYAFGNDSYADFWPKASLLDYKRLNEALNAV